MPFPRLDYQLRYLRRSVGPIAARSLAWDGRETVASCQFEVLRD